MPRKPKVLVISPAGQVYDHDKVKWYDNSQDQMLGRYFNIGDMVVYDSTLKLLDYSEARPMEIIDPRPIDIESYRDFDFAIVRASNFVHNDMDFHKAIEVIEELDIPVYCTGVGGQSADDRPYKLTGRNLRFWEVVADRCNLIGVRGTFSAEVFFMSGIRNVEVCGCPTIFRTRNRALQIEKPVAPEKVAISLRREVSSSYSSNVEAYLSLQRDLLLSADAAYDVTFTSHGELEEKAFFFRDEERMVAAEAEFRASGWFPPEHRERMAEIYRNRHFFFLAVEEYDKFVRGMDFALGMRVHGVLPALANRVPSALIAYDARSQELANTHAIPTVTQERAAGMTAKEIIDSVSFDEFNKLYPVRYDKMKFLHEANGIPHRM